MLPPPLVAPPPAPADMLPPELVAPPPELAPILPPPAVAPPPPDAQPPFPTVLGLVAVVDLFAPATPLVPDPVPVAPEVEPPAAPPAPAAKPAVALAVRKRAVTQLRITFIRIAHSLAFGPVSDQRVCRPNVARSASYKFVIRRPTSQIPIRSCTEKGPAVAPLT
jgi:hypothetical protein